MIYNLFCIDWKQATKTHKYRDLEPNNTVNSEIIDVFIFAKISTLLQWQYLILEFLVSSVIFQSCYKKWQ